MREGSRGTVCSSVDGLLVQPASPLNGGLRYESMFPSICDDVVAMEYAHTALVCAVDSQYSNTSNTNGLALTSGVDEYAFVCHDEFPAIDECSSSPVV
nr:hypothetical protein [Tanacetum cinerariifolium]